MEINNQTITTMPAIAVRGLTVFPEITVNFDLSREKSISAVEKSLEVDSKIFLVTQEKINIEDPTLDDVYSVGTIATIKQEVKLHEGLVRILVTGLKRAKLIDLDTEGDCLFAEVEEVEATTLEDKTLNDALKEGVLDTFFKYAKGNKKITTAVKKGVTAYDEIGELMDYIAYNLPISHEKKQKVLETNELTNRYEELEAILLNEIDITQIQMEYKEKVNERINKHQKEYFLREQLAEIKSELGEESLKEENIENYQKKLDKIKPKKEVYDKIQKEIDRFKLLNPNSPEMPPMQNYLETLLSIPWKKKTKDNKDLNHAKEVLDVEHYGLEKVKERILDYLAVRNLTGKGDTPIICLVGPPGTGKTSIAKSVAKALNKKYVRISLGGVRDEAEIRGHRRTYIGAMPGRIVNGLINAEVRNPLMLLDEIDKISSDYKGDTASALLEVLDPEQNVKFRDHYVEQPVDLSDVLFIATANSVQTISRPLLDRMELIEVSTYTENEKLHIAKEHLLPKQIKANGLKEENISITDEALKKIISNYTKESGVRNLERKLGNLCRKVARKIYEHKAESVKVDKDNIKEYLGKEIYSFDMKNEKDEVGIVRGLAWTSVGGDTLEIEVNVMPGDGKFKLTGQLGDVMKESAQAAISYIRSKGKEYNISPEFFKENDIHIHIPEGAVPKDGPSAGVTMATAMISAITNIPVRADVAMTGEITIRGRVLPIGGLKEKMIAAKIAGIKTICVPIKNQKDVDEISEEIKDGLEIVFVSEVNDALEHALVRKIEG